MQNALLSSAMFDDVVICLDGSRSAEWVIPYAESIAKAAGAGVTLLRVVDYGEDVSGVEDYLRPWAEALHARERVLTVEDDVAATILGELRRRPRALPAMTTHGHTGIWEPLLGSVALGVIRDVGRPVLLYGARRAPKGADPFKVKTVVIALDGGEFAESIIPTAAAMAGSLMLNLELVQAIPPRSRRIPPQLKGDVLEDSYLRSYAAQIEKKYGVKASWDVLHGDPAKAISSHVRGRSDTILAMTSHARVPAKHAMFGSVATECVRRSGIPMLVYRPRSIDS
jgi:nucleotide-binding universal stress UspA family protein